MNLNNALLSVQDVCFEYPTRKQDSFEDSNVAADAKLHRRRQILKNVSFEMHEGEILGVIGRNGSGKSSLAKLISRILFPTTGTLITPSRVAPLIELGAGMDPELTVQENIYLYGVLIGNRLKAVKSRTDRVLEWSGLQEFRDLELRKLSSGMRARLAFAVATEMKPDLLIVDEVLSVGDSEFQKRSRERFDEILRGGTSVLFISHDLVTVQDVCKRSILLQDGQVIMDDSSELVVSRYFDESVAQ